MNMLEQTLGRPCRRTLAALPGSARLALEMLDRIEGGAVAMELPDGLQLRLGHGALVAHWRVRDLRLFDAVFAHGDIALGETYMDGAWDCDDLAALIGLFARNRDTLARGVHGRAWRLVGHRLWHLLRANTRSGARRNIEAHYDLGNDFYAAWLDPTMTYSAGVFTPDDASLESAQLRKYRRILGKLAPRPGETILEIGCGWGGFAEVAATEFGCKVLGLTLSPAQQAFARARAARGGYADRVDFALCDYRDVRGKYRHIVSIEMIEAVGERFWPVYFGQIAALLEPGGRCVIQAITIDDALFDRYRRGTDFIQRHVFPGGMLPAPGSIVQQVRKAGLALHDDFAFGLDYAHTLRQWHARFDAVEGEIRRQGFPQRFSRMWRFYLAYCEAGFMQGNIDVHHYVLGHTAQG